MPRPLAFLRRMRLVHRSDFERTYRQGVRMRGSILIVVARENGLTHARLGLSVGRAIWRDAVDRNRVRRIFRESFRLAQHELPRGVDLILIPAAPKLRPVLEATRLELIELASKAERKLAGRAAAAARAAQASANERAKASESATATRTERANEGASQSERERAP